MTCSVRFSVIGFRWLSMLYPGDFRREFGAEMMEMFEHDLAAEYAARGIRGGLHVWRIALCEVIGIGLPALLQIPAVAVAALSAATAIVSQSPLLIMTIRRHAQLSFRPGDTTLRDALFALAICAAITALTSFVAVYRWERARLIVLGLR